MFGIGMTEIIVILAIALLVIGPEKLPELARTLGKGLAEFKKTAEDFRDSFHEDLKAEEEKGKLLQKAQDNLDQKSKAEKQVEEKPETNSKDATEENPIADEAPPTASLNEDNPPKHD
jgi:sec-independent protein translocase protein TatA